MGLLDKLKNGENVEITVMGDHTIEDKHHYGWYRDENGNRVDFDYYE